MLYAIYYFLLLNCENKVKLSASSGIILFFGSIESIDSINCYKLSGMSSLNFNF